MIVAAPALALVAVSALAEQTLGIAMPLDATAIKAGAPVPVAELDLGRLKGDCGRSDGRQTAPSFISG